MVLSLTLFHSATLQTRCQAIYFVTRHIDSKRICFIIIIIIYIYIYTTVKYILQKNIIRCCNSTIFSHCCYGIELYFQLQCKLSPHSTTFNFNEVCMTLYREIISFEMIRDIEHTKDHALTQIHPIPQTKTTITSRVF